MNTITTWLFSIMTLVAPPQKLAAIPQFKGYEETVEQKEERYKSIAKDLYEVVYDPSFKPLYSGPDGRANTAALVLAIAWHESGFAKDVDVGPCYRGKDNKGYRCDNGKSVCLMQIQIGKGKTNKSHGIEGLSQSDLFLDRKSCFRAGLSLIRRSFAACSKYGKDSVLNAYASGACGLGQNRSDEMLAIVRRMLRTKPVPAHDNDFILSESDPEVKKESSLSLLDSQ